MSVFDGSDGGSADSSSEDADQSSESEESLTQREAELIEDTEFVGPNEMMTEEEVRNILEVEPALLNHLTNRLDQLSPPPTPDPADFGQTMGFVTEVGVVPTRVVFATLGTDQNGNIFTQGVLEIGIENNGPLPVSNGRITNVDIDIGDTGTSNIVGGKRGIGNLSGGVAAPYPTGRVVQFGFDTDDTTDSIIIIQQVFNRELDVAYDIQFESATGGEASVGTVTVPVERLRVATG